MRQVEYRPGRRRVKWIPGLVFALPLADESWGVGQTADLMWPNVGYCALFSARIQTLDEGLPDLSRKSLVALLAVTRHGLALGYWPVLSTSAALFSKADFPNERLAATGYVGATMYDYGVADDLLSAYHGLIPWNTWKDEDFLDTLLAPGVLRPATAHMLSPAERARYRASKGYDAESSAV